MVSGSRDIAFHLSLRIAEGLVIRNSRLSDCWGEEERDIYFNPFMEGQYFEVSPHLCGYVYLRDINCCCGQHQALHYQHLFLPLTRRSPFAVVKISLKCSPMVSTCVLSSIAHPTLRSTCWRWRETSRSHTFTSEPASPAAIVCLVSA